MQYAQKRHCRCSVVSMATLANANLHAHLVYTGAWYTVVHLQYGYAATYNGIFTTIDDILFPWFANLFARRYVPYSRKNDKPITRGTYRPWFVSSTHELSCMDPRLTSPHEHPILVGSSTMHRRPTQRFTQGHLTVWPAGPGLAWQACMVPLGNCKHKGPSFLCQQCMHLAQPLISHGSCFIFHLVQECNFVCGC